MFYLFVKNFYVSSLFFFIPIDIEFFFITLFYIFLHIFYGFCSILKDYIHSKKLVITINFLVWSLLINTIILLIEFFF